MILELLYFLLLVLTIYKFLKNNHMNFVNGESFPSKWVVYFLCFYSGKVACSFLWITEEKKKKRAVHLKDLRSSGDLKDAAKSDAPQRHPSSGSISKMLLRAVHLTDLRSLGAPQRRPFKSCAPQRFRGTRLLQTHGYLRWLITLLRPLKT